MSELIEKCKKGRPLIMGIVNVTPDSFSDGGEFLSADQAIQHGLRLLEEGADILDIGGESTRPNADIIRIEEELSRVIPVIEGLAGKAPFISIDTRNAKTMERAVRFGANIINDISGLSHDSDSISIVANSGLPVCIMHMKGTPQNMQDKPEYDDVIGDIISFFEERLVFCQNNGIPKNKIILDPGIGFGKTLAHNLEILRNMDKFQKFGCPVMLGASRKSFIGAILNESDPQNRLEGSLAAALSGLQQGVQIFRVHDVKETRHAFDVYQAVCPISSSLRDSLI